MKNVDELKGILSSVLPNYEPISKAPTIGAIEEYADAHKIDQDLHLKRESEKRYKSIDSNTGDIYLIQNPACWEMIFRKSDGTRDYDKESRGQFNTRICIIPPLAMSFSEARKGAPSESFTERSSYKNKTNF